jgi:hypothetical protein
MRLATFRSHHRRQLAGVLLLLIGQWFLFASRSVAQAPPSYVKVTLRISVAGKDKAVVDNWEVSILRDGTLPGGTQLKEIKAAVEKGKINQDKTSADFKLDGSTLFRPETDFQLTGKPHKVTVRAEGFELLTKDISDDDLKKASLRDDTVLTIPIELTTNSTLITANSPAPDNNTTPPKTEGDPTGPFGFSKQVFSKLNYTFWLLGLVIFCLFAGWVLLGILARIFHKYGPEKWILRLPPLLARGLVWPFGFRLEFSLNYKTELPARPEVLLRKINDDLAELCKTSAVPNKPRTEAEKIVDNLARLSWSNGAESWKGYLDGIRASLMELSTRNPRSPQEPRKDDSLKSTLKDAVKEALFEGGFVPQESAADEKEAGSLAEKSVASLPQQTRPDHSHKHRAKASYQLLLNHQPVDCKRFFLEADAKGSILGRLADDSVYLMQVGSSQAPFILFLDDNDDGTTGWVFPNPAQGFDKSTLRDVFPTLSETEFNDSKEGIEPAAVIKDGDRRWRVDRETGVFDG